MKKLNAQNTAAEIETKIREFGVERKSRRLRSISLLALALIVVLAILSYSAYKARLAEKQASTAEQAAKQASQKLDVIASDTLSKVLDSDSQAKKLCQCENPTAYVWRGGLHVQPGKPLSQTDTALIALLHDRMRLLSSAGPLMGSSKPLASYICKHLTFVISESLPKGKIDKHLRDLRLQDSRYNLAEYESGQDPYAGVIVGFFLGPPEVRETQKAIGVEPSDIHMWGFNQYQPNCSAQATTN
jgi:hypothetical protein